MADRIPLIVHPNARQIQELPSQDKLLLSGHLEFDASVAGCGDITSTGGNDAIFGIFNSTRVSNLSSIAMHATNTSGANTEVASFVVGANDSTYPTGKVELIAKGQITAEAQPACLLTVPVEYTAENTVQSGTGHEGGQNEKPIAFINETTRVGCTTSLAPNSAQGGTTGITSITVPSAGTYLVSAMMGGKKVSGSGTDQVRFALAKSGIGTFANGLTYPTFVFGASSSGGMEFHANFTLPLSLSANDTLSVHFSHIGATKAQIEEGYFSVTKLH